MNICITGWVTNDCSNIKCLTEWGDTVALTIMNWYISVQHYFGIYWCFIIIIIICSIQVSPPCHHCPLYIIGPTCVTPPVQNWPSHLRLEPNNPSKLTKSSGKRPTPVLSGSSKTEQSKLGPQEENSSAWFIFWTNPKNKKKLYRILLFGIPKWYTYGNLVSKFDIAVRWLVRRVTCVGENYGVHACVFYVIIATLDLWWWTKVWNN